MGKLVKSGIGNRENNRANKANREHVRNSGLDFNKLYIPIYFKPTNTLRQKSVHSKDETRRHKEFLRVRVTTSP